jgi:Ca-activated chloride channel family protein
MPRSRTVGFSRIVRLLPLLLALLLGARTAAAQETPPVAAAPDPGTGEMFIATASGLVPLPPLDMQVDIEVTGPLVQGTVRQTFRNTTLQVTDAVYLFPLPEGAAVDSLDLRIGDREIHSAVREKEAARAEYDGARREGRKAGLVEQARPGLFRTSAASINPGEEVSVVLRFFDQAVFNDGAFSLAFPLTWTRRYVPTTSPESAGAVPATPAGHADACVATRYAAAADPSAPRATIHVDLDGGLPLLSVHSRAHAARIEVKGSRATIDTGPVSADRDFVLDWRYRPAAEPRGAVFLEEHDDDTYGLALLMPPSGSSGGSGAAPSSGLPTRTLFILDVSGSMEGPSLEQARRSLMAALDRLRPGDEFDVLKFATESAPFRDRFQPALAAPVAAARAWVAALGTEGGTEIPAALQHAERLMAEAGGGMVGRFILITDGGVEIGDAGVSSMLAGLGETRLHAIGIGPAPNRAFMRSLALAGRGECTFIGSPDEVGEKLGAFLARIDRPVLADLALEWEGAPPRDALPVRLPDLHAGDPLLVSFRLDPGHPGTRAVLRGRGPEGPLATALDVTPDAPRGAGVAARWARTQVETLLDGAGPRPDSVRDQVVALARDFHLVTRFTSLVAVEDHPTAVGHAVDAAIPNGAPGGVLGVELPQTGTLDPLLLRLGLLLLMTGVVLLLVRRYADI